MPFFGPVGRICVGLVSLTLFLIFVADLAVRRAARRRRARAAGAQGHHRGHGDPARDPDPERGQGLDPAHDRRALLARGRDHLGRHPPRLRRRLHPDPRPRPALGPAQGRQVDHHPRRGAGVRRQGHLGQRRGELPAGGAEDRHGLGEAPARAAARGDRGGRLPPLLLVHAPGARAPRSDEGDPRPGAQGARHADRRRDRARHERPRGAREPGLPRRCTARTRSGSRRAARPRSRG